MSNGVTPAQFIAKWSRVELSERAASQEHFIDLCRLLGQPTPAEEDASGDEYTFDKGGPVTGPASAGSKGERGFADVWWRGKFGWEYKRKDKYKDLAEAYRQLCQYREALGNPRLLIVCDIARTEIHTNFTDTRKEVHTIKLAELGRPENLDKLRRVFTDPQSFKPGLSTWKLTESAAAEFAKLSDALRQRKHDPHDAAHFLMKCMFCLFAEDVKLLPEKLFSKLLERGKKDPDKLPGRLDELFRTMGRGGDFGTEEIAWFNGGLFDAGAALPLRAGEIHTMLIAAQHDWGAVEPSVFGTLFERSLDPGKRAQIGAHYTSREDILEIVKPVVVAPLRREWDEVQARVEKLLTKRRAVGTKAAKKKADDAIAKTIEEFHDRLASVRILDPACGSGNFLYVAIQELLTLEKEVIVFAGRPDIGTQLFPRVRPTQLHGIEINPYAAELAQVVIWIGYLQWMRDNGFAVPRDPILTPLQTIENRDAILDLTIPTKPQPATWPEADFIIGNPPFLGASLLRQGLGTDYAESLFRAFDVPNTSDLCCYWFECARQAIKADRATRAGLLATQGIRGPQNREVLRRICGGGGVFMAWSDRDWILDGAMVHVSMVGFDDGKEVARVLNGLPVACINADLTTDTDLTQVRGLPENGRIGFFGDTKKGKFDITWGDARSMLADKGNPNGRPNSDVLRPWLNGVDLNGRPRGMWIVDFVCEVEKAASYVAPFEYAHRHVKPARDAVRNALERDQWWMHARPANDLRQALARLSRYIGTCRVAKHRIFTFIPTSFLPDGQIIAFARDSDYWLGLLHSSTHELWSRRTGTQLREAESGFRYRVSSCVETFPLPWPPGQEPVDHPAYRRIDEAARELNEQRERWLNPPEWIEALGKSIDRLDDFADVPEEARPLIRWSAIMDMAAHDSRFKKRTLTHLYNERPTWLRLAHEKLDRAVLAAYAATDPDGGWSEDWATVWTETGAGQLPPDDEAVTERRKERDQGVLANLLPDGHALAEARKETDQRVLANLLRLNLARAGAADGVKAP